MIQIVQSIPYEDDIGGSTIPGVFAQATTPGNCIAAFSWSNYPSLQYPTLLSSALDTGVLNGTPGTSDLFYTGYVKNITGGETDYTFTLSGSNQYRRGWFVELSGVDQNAPLVDFIHGAPANYGTGTDAATQSVTTNTPDCLILGLGWDGSAMNIPDLGTGYTNIGTETDGAGDASRLEYKIFSDIGAVAATFTQLVAGDMHYLSVMAFKPAPSGFQGYPVFWPILTGIRW